MNKEAALARWNFYKSAKKSKPRDEITADDLTPGMAGTLASSVLGPGMALGGPDGRGLDVILQTLGGAGVGSVIGDRLSRFGRRDPAFRWVGAGIGSALGYRSGLSGAPFLRYDSIGLDAQKKQVTELAKKLNAPHARDKDLD